MTHYLILAEGGCYGNFLACLIRSMWDLNFTQGCNISDSGSCDHISNALSISILMREHYHVSIYPENSTVADHITELLKTKEYIKAMDEYTLNYDHINTLHYMDKTNVDKFLTVDNVKIVYVTQDWRDYNLIALNKISKNFDGTHSLEGIKKDYGGLLSFYNKSFLEEFNSVTYLNNMSKELKKALVSSWMRYMAVGAYTKTIPDENDRILFVKFNDIINNENKVLEDLAKFTNGKINDTSILFYQNYLESQKKVHEYVNN